MKSRFLYLLSKKLPGREKLVVSKDEEREGERGKQEWLEQVSEGYKL